MLSLTTIYNSMSSLATCDTIKSAYSSANCCEDSTGTLGHLDPTCKISGVALQPGFGTDDVSKIDMFGNVLMFYHAGIGPIHLAKTVYLYGAVFDGSGLPNGVIAMDTSQTPPVPFYNDATENSTRAYFNLPPSTTIVTDNLASKLMLFGGSAQGLLNRNELLVALPTQGISYTIAKSDWNSVPGKNAFVTYPPLRIANAGIDSRFASATIHYYCDVNDWNGNPTPVLGRSPGDSGPTEFYSVNDKLGVVGASDKYTAGANVSISDLAAGRTTGSPPKKFLLAKHDSCWCPTCAAGAGAFVAMALNAAWALDLVKSVQTLPDVGTFTSFIDENFYEKLTSMGCSANLSTTLYNQPNASCLPNFEAYLQASGYPPGMEPFFFLAMQSSVGQTWNSSLGRITEMFPERCLSESALWRAGMPGIEMDPSGMMGNMIWSEQGIDRLNEEIAAAGTDQTGAKYFQYMTGGTFLDIGEYDTPAFPSSTQSTFHIVDAQTGKVVVPQVPAFLIGERSPQSRLIIEYIGSKLGHPLNDIFDSMANRTDWSIMDNKLYTFQETDHSKTPDFWNGFRAAQS